MGEKDPRCVRNEYNKPQINRTITDQTTISDFLQNRKNVHLFSLPAPGNASFICVSFISEVYYSELLHACHPPSHGAVYAVIWTGWVGWLERNRRHTTVGHRVRYVAKNVADVKRNSPIKRRSHNGSKTRNVCVALVCPAKRRSHGTPANWLPLRTDTTTSVANGNDENSMLRQGGA